MIGFLEIFSIFQITFRSDVPCCLRSMEKGWKSDPKTKATQSSPSGSVSADSAKVSAEAFDAAHFFEANMAACNLAAAFFTCQQKMTKMKEKTKRQDCYRFHYPEVVQ